MFKNARTGMEHALLRETDAMKRWDKYATDCD
jgi:hypothetical protein